MLSQEAKMIKKIFLASPIAVSFGATGNLIATPAYAIFEVEDFSFDIEQILNIGDP